MVFSFSFSQENENKTFIDVVIIYNDYPIENKHKKKQFKALFNKDEGLNKYMSFVTIYIYLESKNYKKKVLQQNI